MKFRTDKPIISAKTPKCIRQPRVCPSIITTQQQKKKLFSFFPTTFSSPSTSLLRSQSQLRYSNSYIKVELADEHSHKEITQEKEQETEENSFLDKSENISELRKFKPTTSEKNPKDTWLHKKITWCKL